MSNLVKKVHIKRIGLNSNGCLLTINVDRSIFQFQFRSDMTNPNGSEETATISFLDNVVDVSLFRYLRNINLDQMRSDVLQGFNQMRENDLSGNTRETMEISLVSEYPLEPHFSCKQNKIQSSNENEILQSEVQQKLATVAKDSKVMTFFEDNKCSVCLSSYKEILDNDLHIIVPFCGHPLCCECARNILMSQKKECPRCRGKITAESFSLMKFNAQLEMETQRVFL